ncbi:adenylyltransferase and sulfurtransferase [Pedobacter sp. ok626]|uniref:HesA/MoeB/ThiF family protein n=1 Tax=Pedobacter sp. ok626 TaxID=1761882 RepID=UPI00088D3D87|nr:HesA/MoeB/ThiF family protein [Pedobacter sp. ok626]SDL40287.1 adenylyltransferase and sulfurtransferase [Pedobacter sp. ok626]
MNKQYYKSHLKLDFIAITGQHMLNRSKVLVIGAGGLGCPCLMALTASGIGNIGIADGDIISTTNISRQTLFNYTDTGKSKTTAAIHALSTRNPYLLYHEHRFFVDEENILQLIEAYDVIVDATDNFEARYLINDACVVKDKPLVYGAIFQTEGHLTVFNYKNSATLRCLFPEPDQGAYIPSCSDTGAYMIATNIIGTMMANEVIKTILGQEDILSGKLLSYEALSNHTIRTTYYPDKLSKNISHSRFKALQKPIELTAEAFMEKAQATDVELIDVRTTAERIIQHIGGKHIPLPELSLVNLTRFPSTQHFYLYCQTGARSLQAAKWLRAKGYKNAFSLKNGITNFNYQFQNS